jgi:3-deoxy-manno-octulosonate cytidylyltransferase (CMP-KDO synthetase)
VIVATDHRTIADEVRSFGGRVVMTDAHCASGTDRAAEVVRGLPDARIIVNLQGDEPEIDPTAVDEVIRLLASDPTLPMATLATPLTDDSLLADPGCVKVVFDEVGRALYFSRSTIPFVRDPKSLPMNIGSLHYQHLGIYAYRREFLLELSSWQPSRLERLEMLEQLRVLEKGRTIKVGVIPHGSRGIDTPDDYAAFVQRQQAQKSALALAVA